MSTIESTEDAAIESSQSEVEINEPAQPKEDLSLLMDRTPEWLRWPAVSLVFAVLIGAVYWLYSVTPLTQSDLWAHVAYGRWTAENGIPETEPLMPLCEGMSMPAVDWLWDLCAYALADSLGPQGLKFLAAVPIALAITFLIAAIYRRTWSGAWTVLAALACLWILHKQLFIRPQLVGLTMFTAAWFVAREGRRWQSILAIGAIFVFWTNMHGSWPIGIAMLAALTVGRALDLLRRTGAIGSLIHDKKIRRLLVMTEVAAVAVLLNPEGWAIYPAVLSIADNPNVDSLIEWTPLTLQMKQGQAFAVIAAVLVMLYRVSPRRVSFAEPLLLMTLTAATFNTSRYIVWLAPLMAYYLALHGSASWRAWRKSEIVIPEGKGLWAAASVGFIWIAFALAPQYRAMTGADRPTFDDVESLAPTVIGDETPVRALAYLREHPPKGIVYNDLAFGDSLLWFGPKGIQPFVHSHAHLTPRAVWQDYFYIAAGRAALSRLDGYGVNTAVLDVNRGKNLSKEMTDSGDWEVAFRDSRASVLRRTNTVGPTDNPIPSAANNSNADH